MSGVAPTTAIGRSDVELAADGDEVAFGRLVALHYDDMAKVAFVIVGDSDRCVELPAPDVGDENVPPAFMRRRNERQPRTVRRPSRVDIDRAVSQERAGHAAYWAWFIDRAASWECDLAAAR